MLCRTAHTGSTYNELRLKHNCNVIVIMIGDFAGDYKPDYVLDSSSIINTEVRDIKNFKPRFKHFCKHAERGCVLKGIGYAA